MAQHESSPRACVSPMPRPTGVSGGRGLKSIPTPSLPRTTPPRLSRRLWRLTRQRCVCCDTGWRGGILRRDGRWESGRRGRRRGRGELGGATRRRMIDPAASRSTRLPFSLLLSRWLRIDRPLCASQARRACAPMAPSSSSPSSLPQAHGMPLSCAPGGTTPPRPSRASSIATFAVPTLAPLMSTGRGSAQRSKVPWGGTRHQRFSSRRGGRRLATPGTA